MRLVLQLTLLFSAVGTLYGSAVLSRGMTRKFIYLIIFITFEQLASNSIKIRESKNEVNSISHQERNRVL